LNRAIHRTVSTRPTPRGSFNVASTSSPPAASTSSSRRPARGAHFQENRRQDDAEHLGSKHMTPARFAPHDGPHSHRGAGWRKRTGMAVAEAVAIAALLRNLHL
jgi:hypothetical protein